ncbi:hypothetical protein CEXT_481491 [Caerostris extrusa]|uniref:Uncharacterized protein n=1 Tax=Caerostris extrusa TaxID=172846 RepID=A0AAV4YBQ9_CAEEX|nr:hypothetical protein CEXT_481491 [Caerostris extrusa]
MPSEKSIPFFLHAFKFDSLVQNIVRPFPTKVKRSWVFGRVEGLPKVPKPRTPPSQAAVTARREFVAKKVTQGVSSMVQGTPPTPSPVSATENHYLSIV